MKLLITDYRIKLKPSKDLINFILSLENDKIMPKNILYIIKSHNTEDDIEREILEIPVIKKEITDNQLNALRAVDLNEIDTSQSNKDNEKYNEHIAIKKKDENSSDCINSRTSLNSKIENFNFILELNDLKWIEQILSEKRERNSKIKYLHEYLEGCELILPENVIVPRNAELEARCQKLRAQSSAKDYRKMTKNVDATLMETPEESIGYQLKAINRQLIAVLQFIFSVAAGFAFGFIGVELIIGNLDFGFRLLLGVMCALTIAVAEIYFLAKKLNEYDNI